MKHPANHTFNLQSTTLCLVHPCHASEPIFFGRELVMGALLAESCHALFLVPSTMIVQFHEEANCGVVSITLQGSCLLCWLPGTCDLTGE
jgi:hypothetical protein